MSQPLYLRVNGIQIESVTIRNKMVDGAPVGDREVVIEDPVLGKFAIDNTFVLEFTRDRRRKWEITNVENFIAMSVPIEAT